MRRKLGDALLLLGMVCLLVVGWAFVEARILATAFEDRFSSPVTEAAPVPVAPGDPLGWLRIPRLGVSALVREGIEESVLRASVGHVPGTALPGTTGNLVLAAHRDTFFRALEGARPGDRIELASAGGVTSYRVRGTSIVSPERTELLRSGPESALTLITCYPFRYVGPAPQRFVVRASLEGAVPSG